MDLGIGCEHGRNRRVCYDVTRKLEKRTAMELCYNDQGLIPCIVQEVSTGDVLMMAWMNAQSLELTRTTGTTWFWSRSRQELWNKGATSGNIQHVRELYYDCDADCLLCKVDPEGPACHTGEHSCFFRSIELQVKE